MCVYTILSKRAYTSMQIACVCVDGVIKRTINRECVMVLFCYDGMVPLRISG